MNSVDLLITDMPYNIDRGEHDKFTAEQIVQLAAVAKWTMKKAS